MTFTTTKNLFRNLFSNYTFKVLCCGIAGCNLLAMPSFAAKGNPIFDAAEYEEWGLDYPGKTTGTDSDSDSDEVETQAPPATPQPPLTQRPSIEATAAEPTLPTGGPVPQDVVQFVDQSAVHVILFFPDGNHMLMPGWIVDAERRIVMTFDLLDGASQIKIAYPQDTSVTEEDISASEAVVLKYEGKMDCVYLQAKFMPEAVANLSLMKPAPTRPVAQRPTTPQPPVVVHRPTAPQPPRNGGFNSGETVNTGGGFNGGQQGGFQRPAQSPNRLVGSWILQDTLNGTQIRIGVAFDAQDQFAMQMFAVDGYGQQKQHSSQGTYTVNGNTLTTNSSDGVESSNFWFENGMLYVQMESMGTTLIFQPAS